MAEATEEGDVVQHSQRVHGYPRDLLQRFASNKRSEESPSAAKEEPGELELSLGLSLGGCFGSDFKDNSLVRSSSIASLSFLTTDQEITAIPVLARTCSLPVETEEEQRKRKELQSLRRMEAKRKRSEKRNFKSGVKDRTDNCDEDMLDGDGKEGRFEFELGGCRRFPGNVQFPVPNGVKHLGYEAAVGTRAAGRVVDGSRCFAPISQGSIGSQGSSSSVVSDFECRPMQGCGISGPGIPDHKDQKTVVPPAASIARKVSSSTGEDTGDATKKMMGRGDGMKEMERNVMEEMPCVSTKGDGPNGRRIEGFLYRYRKGEDVRIMCVCHGSFLSPAEFVKHAGGGDVAHPLRHIVVNPSPSTFL